MKKQKFLALFLVAALTLSLGATAFAADPDPVTATTTGKTTINVTSELKLPAIKVTIATPTGIIVNPYGMEVTLPSVADPITDTVISTPRLITNGSDIKIKITAEPTASVADGSTVTISTVRVEDLDGKAVYMSLAMANSKNDVCDTYTGVDTDKFTNTDSAIFTNKTAAEHNSCSITLKAAEEKGKYPTYGVYLITGESKGTDWKPTLDVVDVQLVFDIQPDLTPAA